MIFHDLNYINVTTFDISPLILIKMQFRWNILFVRNAEIFLTETYNILLSTALHIRQLNRCLNTLSPEDENTHVLRKGVF